MRIKKSLPKLTNGAKLRAMNKKCLDAFLTLNEAAALRGCTPEGILRAIKDKRLVAGKKGRQWMIHRPDFDAFMAEKGAEACDR